jgi:16S rRNA (cytosine1402-N4)-methyltransferase
VSLPYHIPVLLEESVDALNIKPDGVYIDVTFGGGGHSRHILSKLGEKGKLIAFDQDRDVLENTPEDERFKLILQNFRYIKNALLLYGIKEVDGILADLGVSSHQFDTPERGFSYRFDADLDMRMNTNLHLTAKEVINTYEAKELIRVFSDYGEVRNTKSLVHKLIQYREDKEIETTNELCQILEKMCKPNMTNKYFAQIFQALRIEVNQEMEVLKDFLKNTTALLKPEGRLSVITYHSLEDRLVKRFMNSGNFEGKIEKDFYGNPLTPFKKITKKPILAPSNEIQDNSRARSAKLRVAEKKIN